MKSEIGKEWGLAYSGSPTIRGAKTKTQVRNLRQELKQTPWKNAQNAVYRFDLCGWLSCLTQDHLSRVPLLSLSGPSSMLIKTMPHKVPDKPDGGSSSLEASSSQMTLSPVKTDNEVTSTAAEYLAGSLHETHLLQRLAEDNWESFQRCYNMLGVDR